MEEIEKPNHTVSRTMRIHPQAAGRVKCAILATPIVLVTIALFETMAEEAQSDDYLPCHAVVNECYGLVAKFDMGTDCSDLKGANPTHIDKASPQSTAEVALYCAKALDLCRRNNADCEPLRSSCLGAAFPPN